MDKICSNKNLKKYRLIYFDVRGRGEIPRLLFHAADVNFEDTRVDPGEEWKNKFKNRECAIFRLWKFETNNPFKCFNPYVQMFTAAVAFFFAWNQSKNVLNVCTFVFSYPHGEY